ncbi:DinB family protein [Actinoplanes sp. NPDC051861]|uniref:DinB family protein n=1 Tax=Actinoplanes sp. NPDC051861 TaxID=3155170 RepID=UPI003429EB2D
MTAKEDLHTYLRQAREALVWKMDGLSSYDVRRPLVPTGTNLLGLVKHVTGITSGYFGVTFGRPFPEPVPWFGTGAEPNADMWATPDESREHIVGLYHRVWSHADATIGALDLDAVGHVPWWAPGNEVTLNRILTHMLAELNRHAGHADILRELLDGDAGWRSPGDHLASTSPQWWAEHRARLEAAAQKAA